jgi:integrase
MEGLAMRRYYLHKRKNIFYAELVSPEGRRSTAKSTGKTTEDEALLVVSKWLSEGIPKKGKEKPVETVMGLSDILKTIKKTDLDGNDAMKIIEALKKKDLVDFTVTKVGSGSKEFTEFLEEFWDYSSSLYVQEKKTQGKTIGKRHCYEMLSRVHTYYTDYFANRSLESITWKDLRDFSLFLTKKRVKPENYKGNFAEELSAAYRNKILIAGKTALKWAFTEELIATDPTARKVSCVGTPEKRRVLTPLEAELIFNKVQWQDKRSYIGNLLSITTGLRAGEVLALRKSDIDPIKPILHCQHSFSTMDGLKSTKNGEPRKIPLLPEVKTALMELLGQNPHKDNPDPFIFYGILADKPMDQKILIGGLKMACKAAAIEPVVFHAHRHFYTARLADKMTADQVMRITGHKTRAIYDEYQNHLTDKNIEDMGKAAAEVFENIIPFRKVG